MQPGFGAASVCSGSQDTNESRAFGQLWNWVACQGFVQMAQAVAVLPGPAFHPLQMRAKVFVRGCQGPTPLPLSLPEKGSAGRGPVKQGKGPRGPRDSPALSVGGQKSCLPPPLVVSLSALSEAGFAHGCVLVHACVPQIPRGAAEGLRQGPVEDGVGSGLDSLCARLWTPPCSSGPGGLCFAPSVSPPWLLSLRRAQGSPSFTLARARLPLSPASTPDSCSVSPCPARPAEGPGSLRAGPGVAEPAQPGVARPILLPHSAPVPSGAQRAGALAD